MKIQTEVVVSAAHFLPGYPGKCANLHGHNWRIQVDIEGGVDGSGMVVDFAWVKGIIKEKLDHTILNIIPGGLFDSDSEYKRVSSAVLKAIGINPNTPGVLKMPTAENLAGYVGELIIQGLEELGDAADKIAVKVWESDVSYAQATLGKDF